MILLAAISLGLSASYPPRSEAAPAGGRPPPPAAPPAWAVPPAPPEQALGIADTGIWPDLDGAVQLAAPEVPPSAEVALAIDRRRGLVVLAIDGAPRKAYPLGGPAPLMVNGQVLALRPGDRAELAALLPGDRPARVTEAPAPDDADRDGVPDPLDVLIGAKKTVLNADAYTEGYVALAYPGGDVPRAMGVCTDVVVRAVRNAGVDLQRAVHQDLRRARGAYPMVQGAGDPSIDHRRVRTLLPYFRRHWQARAARVDDPADPWWPGDVVFLDTIPGRAGPDHIGIVSDRRGDSGLPLIINNWTNGTVTAEMDLLPFVPVLHRFRFRPPSR